MVGHVYARSTREEVMRLLAKTDVPFYAPVIPGDIVRPQAASAPVTSRYLRTMCFVCGDEVARHSAVCTGCVSRWMPVGQPAELVEDLRQLHSLITMDAPLSPERRLEPGTKVRIRSGPFAGYEGVVFRRDRETDCWWPYVSWIKAFRLLLKTANLKKPDCHTTAIWI